ncbi:hypothetical protein ACJMK2_030857 [Sinanodonta woodiana]|uniref:Protein kinase domain-containing protein n=1 Tax=Sinanodonta woodiana TaxID=1069815 RepID=A0ABD3WXK9_SINWO
MGNMWTSLMRQMEKRRKSKKLMKRLKGQTVGQFTLGDIVTKGCRSVIYSIKRNEVGVPLVAKVLDLSFSETMVHEFEVLRRLDHPGVVKAVDLFRLKSACVLVLEAVMNGDLQDNILKQWPIAHGRRRAWAFQISSAVEYIHSMGVAHCDIKLENIMINSSNRIKLIDFGSAINVLEGQQTRESLEMIAITPEYVPPEILCQRLTEPENYDVRMMDVWGVGVVFFLMLTGRFPFGEFDGYHISDFIDTIASSEEFVLKEEEELVAACELGYIDMLARALDFDPDERSSMKEIMSMEYFN